MEWLLFFGIVLMWLPLVVPVIARLLAHEDNTEDDIKAHASLPRLVAAVAP